MAKCTAADCTGTIKVAVVDNTGNGGTYTSIAIGNDGLPVISYLFSSPGPQLRVAKCVAADCSGATTVTTLDSTGAIMYSTSIAVPPDGLPIVSYYSNTGGDLKVARCANPSCTGTPVIVVVDSTDAVGQFSSITIGTDGLPVVSYYDTTGQSLKITKCANPFCLANLSRR